MGYGIIDVETNILPDAVWLFPSTYRVVGSRESIAPDTVRLVVQSDDITDGIYPSMTCTVQDVGSTRTIRMEPLP